MHIPSIQQMTLQGEKLLFPTICTHTASHHPDVFASMVSILLAVLGLLRYREQVCSL
jgi:hypothetical protein